MAGELFRIHRSWRQCEKTKWLRLRRALRSGLKSYSHWQDRSVSNMTRTIKFASIGSKNLISCKNVINRSRSNQVTHSVFLTKTASLCPFIVTCAYLCYLQGGGVPMAAASISNRHPGTSYNKFTAGPGTRCRCLTSSSIES